MSNYSYSRLPERAALDMPVQYLSSPAVAKRFKASRRTVLFRAMVISLSFLLCIPACVCMAGALFRFGTTLPASLFFGLFCLNFLWIAHSMAAAVVGLFARSTVWPEAEIAGSKTAIIMPMYNEDPRVCFQTLHDMGMELQRKGVGKNFEFCVLSDTTDQIRLAEEIRLFRRMLAANPNLPNMWYRHRNENTGKKVENIRQFLANWGGRWDYLIVLDADSVMTAETVLTMSKRMQGDPNLGLLQSVPKLRGGTTLYAKLQEFASDLYGRLNARGTAAWSGTEGNYWGHNAIIRSTAFASCCGLPKLPGKAPLGGYILSHDFIEAALLRKGGWKVCIDPELEGSYEQSPPSLSESAARDRRWMQGNMQHLRLLATRGFAAASRKHLFVGIWGYLSSIAWFAMICLGLTFPQAVASASPVLGKLFVFTMAVLFGPKCIALLFATAAHFRAKNLKAAGLLALNFTGENIFSILTAPIQMLVTVGNFLQIILGRDSGWNSQNRLGKGDSWRKAMGLHWLHSFCGLALGIYLAMFVPAVLPWFSAMLPGLILAIPLSRYSSMPFGTQRPGDKLCATRDITYIYSRQAM